MRYRSRPARKSSAGFTLLELIAVLMILASGAAIVSFAMGRAHDKAALKDAGAGVAAALRYGRESALMGRVPVSFRLEGGEYWLEAKGKDLMRRRKLPQGVAVKDPVTVVFFPKGNSGGGSFTLAGRGERGINVGIDPSTAEARLSGL